MSLSIGIVGLPNVGKSTLFNALSKNSVLAANYPFATIEPNVGIVNVPDKKLHTLAGVSRSQKTVPAACTFVDIAGIVRGASTGEGLGNKFLSNIRQCNAIVQVVRVFEEGDVIHVDGKVDAKSDIETINTELILADIETVTNRLEKVKSEFKSNPKAQTQLQVLEKIKSNLDAGRLASSFLTESDIEFTAELQLLTAKPFIIVYNLAEDQLSDKELHAKLETLVSQLPTIFLSAKTESELQDLPDEQAQELLQSLGQNQSGLESLIQIGYSTLGLQSFYTSGESESRAWTIKKGSSAPQAAGVIHTDFEKGFIKAEVVDYADFVSCNGWIGSKQAGKVRLEGKDYIMRSDDVVLFKTNT